MTIRTFWTIFIKILGIWLVLSSVTVIPQFILTFVYAGSNDTSRDFALAAGLLLLTIGIYVFILRLFVFKTAWLIDKLHLEKGFDGEKIDLNVQLSTVLTVTTIVLGGLMFVDSLPQLCKQTFMFFQEKDLFRESPTSGWIIFYFVNTMLGYLLMTNSKQVVEFIQKKIATPH
jgi:cytochrome c biogenesis factor